MTGRPRSIYLDDETWDRLQELAASANQRTGELCRSVLVQVAQGERFVRPEFPRSPHELMLLKSVILTVRMLGLSLKGTDKEKVISEATEQTSQWLVSVGLPPL